MADERRTPPAARLLRIWHLAEHIAANPGESRLDLSRRFHVSERQIQGDLLILREDMGLPLIRRSGYRFVGEGPASGPAALTLHEALVMVMVLSHADRDPSIPKAALARIADRLPNVFPPHVQPFVAAIVPVLRAPRPTGEQRVLLAVMNALLRSTWVQCHRARGQGDPVIRPEVLLPFRGGWHVLGERQRPSLNGETLAAVSLDDVHDVTVMRVVEETVRSLQPAREPLAVAL